jgi:hypothetical protein
MVRHLVIVGALFVSPLAAFAAACGSGSGSPSRLADDAGAFLDGPLTSDAASGSDAMVAADGGACIADGEATATTPCCAGLRNVRSHCTTDNVDYGATCAPAPCGGDVRGTWTLVGACGTAECGTPGSGAVVGIGAVGVGNDDAGTVVGLTLNYVAEFAACGWRDGEGNDGTYLDGDGGTLMPYCVQGSTLWVFPDANVGHTVVTALRFSKSP